MADETDLFFKPRQTHIQGRLEFLDIPPARILAFPIEAIDFDGINLHWNGSESVICTNPETCELHKLGNKARPYYYAQAYLYGASTDRWTPFILGVGLEISLFAQQKLVGRAWKVSPRINKSNRKKGLLLSRHLEPGSHELSVPKLEPFDIKPRILHRYNLA